MEVAIFGAGVAGLTAALMLEQRGHRWRIYERACQHPDVGMGVILTRECTSVLGELGISVDGTPLHHYRQHDANGALTFSSDMPSGVLGIRRRDLMRAMTGMLSPLTSCIYGAGLENLQFDQDGNVTLAKLTSGEDVRADLYIAADGLRSIARRHMFPDWDMKTARVMEIVALVEFGELHRWAANRLTKYYATQCGAAFGIVPVNEHSVVWYCQFDAERHPPPPCVPDARREFMHALVGGWCDPIPALLNASDYSRVHLWRPIDADLVPHFHQRNLVLIGDAAHPVLPFTSQGTAAAVTDAVALTQALDNFDDLHRGLAWFSAARRAECKPYIEQGRAMTKAFLDPAGCPGAVPIAVSRNVAEA